jgi:hypothetical protein
VAWLVSILRQGCEGERLGQTAMPINPFKEQGVFDPEAIAAMGEAFDAACGELDCTTQPEVVRELIAGLIIAAACRGELDPVRLRMVAVAGFAICCPRGRATSGADAEPKVSARAGARERLPHAVS